VDAKVYDAFLEKLQARVSTIKVGAAENLDNYMGPVISDGARRTILQYIETGKGEGRVLPVPAAAPAPGAPAARGYFVPPTVIADVDSKARIFQEEIFGPVLAVTKARDFDHAMELANDSQYGLTGAIFSNVPEHIERARRQFFVGNLYVNRKCTGAMVGAHPFGGFNMSGTDSKGGGPDYMILFLQAKSIAERVV
jgi:1-pyrroline-5-carboxylate dehydrogenase